MDAKLPTFPQRVCPKGEAGACGFEMRGVHWLCAEGQACGKRVYPGEDGYDEITAYYKAARGIGAPTAEG